MCMSLDDQREREMKIEIVSVPIGTDDDLPFWDEPTSFPSISLSFPLLPPHTVSPQGNYDSILSSDYHVIPLPNPNDMPDSPPTTEEEEKFRLRRERAALWKKQQEEKRLKQVEEVESSGADSAPVVVELKSQEPVVGTTEEVPRPSKYTHALARTRELSLTRCHDPPFAFIEFTGFSLKPKTSTATAAPGKPPLTGFSLGKKSTTPATSGFAFKSAGSTTSPTTTVAKGALAAALEDEEEDDDDPATATTVTMPIQKKLKLTKFSFNEEGSAPRQRSPARSAAGTAVTGPSEDTTMEPAEDPLEAFMGHVQMEVEKLQHDDQKRLQEMSSVQSLQPGGTVGSTQAIPLSDSDEEEDGFLGAGQGTTTPADDDPLLG